MSSNGADGTSTNGGGDSKPEIILYTNHQCPWAHRGHIALKELGLPFKEVIIDLDKPREPWYLEINPRGLVPSIKYNNHIITESAIVTQFLADAHPAQLLPPTTSPSNALFRARVAFFVDAFISKVLPKIFAAQTQRAEDKDADTAARDIVAAVAKELEPLFTWDISSSSPFFGGSNRLTLAEVQTASFLIRLLSFSKPEHNLLSPHLNTLLAEQTPKFTAWARQVVQQPSVTDIWDERTVVERTKARIAKLAAAAAAEEAKK
ncbi:hypothetical protein KCU88_g6333, partial [Aureobasidium melanogenum]